MAVPHYTYLVLKMPGPRETITVKGSFKLSDLCDKEFHKMAQTFGMTANQRPTADEHHPTQNLFDSLFARYAAVSMRCIYCTVYLQGCYV
jgi:hypothetical protein